MEQRAVGSLFNAIASRYDFLNHLLSGGVDLYWRRQAIRQLRDLQPGRILDVATGTADLAIASLTLHPAAVVGVDVASEMLHLGQRKLRERGLSNSVSLTMGAAENLPFADNAFDAAMVSFGARNFENLRVGLAEMRRVVRPGGKLVVLEFSRPTGFPFKQLYFFYFRRILPFVGRFVSGHEHAYTYLPETVMRFPEGEEFIAILNTLGFSSTTQQRLTFGVASVYTAIK